MLQVWLLPSSLPLSVLQRAPERCESLLGAQHLLAVAASACLAHSQLGWSQALLHPAPSLLWCASQHRLCLSVRLVSQREQQSSWTKRAEEMWRHRSGQKLRIQHNEMTLACKVAAEKNGIMQHNEMSKAPTSEDRTSTPMDEAFKTFVTN